MPLIRALSLGAAGALVVACHDAPIAPPNAPAIVVAPAVRASLDDARLRLVPALDTTSQAVLNSALGALDDALSAGDRTSVRHATANLRTLLASGDDATAADRSAIAMTLDLLDQ